MTLLLRNRNDALLPRGCNSNLLTQDPRHFSIAPIDCCPLIATALSCIPSKSGSYPRVSVSPDFPPCGADPSGFFSSLVPRRAHFLLKENFSFWESNSRATYNVKLSSIIATEIIALEVCNTIWASFVAHSHGFYVFLGKCLKISTRFECLRSRAGVCITLPPSSSWHQIWEWALNKYLWIQLKDRLVQRYSYIPYSMCDAYFSRSQAKISASTAPCCFKWTAAFFRVFKIHIIFPWWRLCDTQKHLGAWGVILYLQGWYSKYLTTHTAWALPIKADAG